MSRSRVLPVLAAIGLAVGLGTPAPASADSELSEGCAYFHGLSGQDIFTTASVFFAPKTFTKGEKLTFTGTTDPEVDLVVNVNFPNEDVLPQHGSTGVPITYTVPFDTGLSFKLLSNPQSGVHWKVDCGVPAAKKAQTISFTDDPPTGLVWGRDGVGLHATSSSGLPVTYSLDPASTGCSGPYPAIFGGWYVGTERPGTCIVSADQAGNAEYDAAPTAHWTFTIGKRPSYLIPAKVTKGLLNLFPTTFKATLNVDDIFGPGSIIRPHPGQQITFSVDGKEMCTGTTDASGEAKCSAKLGWTKTLQATEYTATWAGDDYWVARSAAGVLK